MASRRMSTCERRSHDIFANSLRCDDSTHKDAEKHNRKRRFIQEIAAMAAAIQCPNTLRVDLMKIMTLETLGRQRLNFLKAAIPCLVLAARSCNDLNEYENKVYIIKRWAGIPLPKPTTLETSMVPGEKPRGLYISVQAFKNALMRLLCGHSCDVRVIEMQQLCQGNPSMDPLNNCYPDKFSDDKTEKVDVECAFKPYSIVDPNKKVGNEDEWLKWRQPTHTVDLSSSDAQVGNKIDFHQPTAYFVNNNTQYATQKQQNIRAIQDCHKWFNRVNVQGGNYSNMAKSQQRLDYIQAQLAQLPCSATSGRMHQNLNLEQSLDDHRYPRSLN